MRTLVHALVATGFCLALEPALAGDRQDMPGNTHDMTVLVHNRSDQSVIYASLGGEDWISVDQGKQGSLSWQVKQCPPDDGALVYVSTQKNIGASIGSSTYKYEEEQNGCHLKLDSITVEPDYRGQYDLVDKNDTHSEDKRDLSLEPAG